MTDLITILVSFFAVPIILVLIVATALGRFPRFARFSLPRASMGAGMRAENLGVVLAVVAIALAILDIVEVSPRLGTEGATVVALVAVIAVISLVVLPSLARIAISLAAVAISFYAIAVDHGSGSVLVVLGIVALLVWLLGATSRFFG